MAKQTFGCTFQLSPTAITGTTGKLSQVTSVSFPNYTTGKTDVTHHESPGGVMEYLPDLVDTDEFTIDINVTPGDTTDVACRTAASSRALNYYVIKVPGSAGTLAFSGQGVVTSYKLDPAPIKGVFSAKLTIQNTSSPTVA